MLGLQFSIFFYFQGPSFSALWLFCHSPPTRCALWPASGKSWPAVSSSSSKLRSCACSSTSSSLFRGWSMGGPCGRKRLYIWCKGETFKEAFQSCLYFVAFYFIKEAGPRGHSKLWFRSRFRSTFSPYKEKKRYFYTCWKSHIPPAQQRMSMDLTYTWNFFRVQ